MAQGGDGKPKLRVPAFQLKLTPQQSLHLFMLKRLGAFSVEPTALLRGEIDQLIERLAGKLGMNLGDLVHLEQRLSNVAPDDVPKALHDVWMPTEPARRKARDD